MQKMSVLLFSGRNDGFGCVVIEVQACRIPEAVGENGICVLESENFILEYADAVVKWVKQKHDSKKNS